MSHSSTLAATDLREIIQQFLQNPPLGTPKEIIDSFTGLDTGQYLSPKLFLQIVEQAPIAISITDPTANILYVNQAFERLTGYTRQEILQQNESILSSPSTPANIYHNLWQTIKDNQVWQGHLVNLCKNGEEYPAELIISPVLNASGQVLYYLGMHRDITELHQLGQQLEFQKDFNEAVLNAVPMVVALVDSNRDILMENYAYKALSDDFEGAEPAHLLIEALEQQLGLNLGNMCQQADGSFRNIEVRLDLHNRSHRWFSCSGTRVTELDEAARHYFQKTTSRCCLLLTANEITQSRQRLHQARVNMLRANVAEQQIMHSMHEAVLAAIYKLQAPLNVIKAALAISGQYDKNDSLYYALEQAFITGEQAIESLQAVLPEDRSEQNSSINMNELVEEVLHLATEQLLAAGITIDWKTIPVLPAYIGKTNALRNVFKYLLDNAIQAIIESGHDYRFICLRIAIENHELVIQISDTGEGIAAIHQHKMFEPFFCGWQHNKSHAGLGLTMAQEIINDHGGSLTLDLDYISGCRMIVRLPFTSHARETV